jgi:predicted ATPase
MVPPLVGSWLFYISSGRFDDAEEMTRRIFEVAQATGERDLLLQAHHAAWPIPAIRGAFAESRPHIEQGLALYDLERHRHHALTYMGHDPAVCAHAVGSIVGSLTGRLAEAEDHASNAVRLARRLEHAPTLALALWFVGCAHAARGEAGRTRAMTDELLRLSEEQKLPQMRASALILGGWALAAHGEPKPARQQIDTGLSIWRGIGMRNFLQLFGVLAADASLRARGYEEAFRHASEALAIGAQTGERWWEPRALSAQGSALVHLGEIAAAEERFEAALRCARKQGAKTWELRAAASLARIWAEQGERQKALDLLAPVHGWFTEGLDAPDLIEARDLLNSLA